MKKHAIKLFIKYQIFTLELYHPVKSSNEKLYVKFVCHKHLYKNKIPCQTVCNKMAMKMCLYKDF